MANLQLDNDKIYTIPLGAVKQSDQSPAGWPNGIALTAASDHPASLGAAIATLGVNAYGLRLTPLVQASTGINVTVSAPGLVSNTMTFDIIADPNLLQIVSDTAPADWTTSQQGVPTNPGP